MLLILALYLARQLQRDSAFAARLKADPETVLAARDLYEFDNVFTAPLHGFASTEDYWARASAKPLLHTVQSAGYRIADIEQPPA